MHLHRSATTSAAVVALFAFGTTAAPAATEQEITDALTALFAATDGKAVVTLGTPTVEGDSVVYKDVSFTSDTPEGPGKGTIGTLTVTGGETNGAGGLTADSITAETISMTDASGGKLDIAMIEAVAVDVTPKSGDQEGTGKFESILAEDLAFTGTDEPPVAIESIQVEAGDYVGAYPRSMALAVEGVAIDVDAAAQDEPSAQQLKALGYETIVVGVFASGNWDEAAGTLTLEDFTIESQDMGSVTLSGLFGGFTPDVVAGLQTPEPSPELMQKITLNEAALTFYDDSITGRLLDMQASQMGADRATFVTQITAALPLMLSAVGNPAFQDKLATAATAFLKDPQNITISVAPGSPVDLMTLMMTGQTAPQTLPDVLNAEVTANEPEEE